MTLETAPLTAKVFDEASTGQYSLLELCDIAEELGLKTLCGNAFTPAKMLRLLKNPFYKGYVTGHKFDIEVKGVHEPLVDENLWERVQMQLAVRGKAPYRSHRHKHILRGLVRCACGMAMTGEFHDNGRNAYLRCVSTANARYQSCGRTGPRIDSVIGQLESEILPAISVSDNQLDIIREELRGLLNKDHHTIEAETHILREGIAKVENQLNTLLDIRLDGEITKEEFQEKRADLDLNKARLTQRLEKNTAVLSRGEEELDQALALANRLMTLWAESDDEGRWKILKAIFVKFVVDGRRIVDIELHPPYNWLMRWKPEGKEAPMASPMASSDAVEVYSNPTSHT